MWERCERETSMWETSIGCFPYVPQLYPNWWLNHFNAVEFCPGQVAQLVRVSSHTPKIFGFCPWLGRMPRLWVISLVGARVGGNQLMFLTSMFLSLPLSASFSLSPHPALPIFLSLCLSLSQISKHILRRGLKTSSATLLRSTLHEI